MICRIDAPESLSAPEGFFKSGRGLKDHSPLSRIDSRTNRKLIINPDLSVRIAYHFILSVETVIRSADFQTDVLSFFRNFHTGYFPSFAQIIEYRSLGIMVRIASSACQRKRHQPRTSGKYLSVVFLHGKDHSGSTVYQTGEVLSVYANTGFILFHLRTLSGRCFHLILLLLTHRNQVLIGHKSSGVDKFQAQLSAVIGNRRNIIKYFF